ncbi:MAG: hypothetical protein E7046_09945 [Lentisphaerae bacterium]|nr:hypothetical protein [Lentisphaerota bacterium]
MNTKKIGIVFAGLMAVASCVIAAEPVISDVAACQRWPWSPLVDIDFVLAGTNCDVVITAQYDGAAPFELNPAHMSGDLFDVKPGKGHVVWDPVAAGFGDKTFPNFTVTVEPLADASSRTYLILDLKDGSYEYASSAPEEGWAKADNALYRTSKMVFRRIPGGKFYMGYPKGIRDYLESFAGNGKFNVAKYLQHEVTLSSDYYMSVFLTTECHYCCITGVWGTATYNPKMKSAGQYKSASYQAVRGVGTTWPNGDKYAVAEDSILDMMRRYTKGKIPDGWIIDLPTSAQWERACKATMPTNWIYYVESTVDDDAAALTNIVDSIASCKISPTKHGTTMAQRLPNQWGIYDMLGLQAEWVLDHDWSAPSGECYEPMIDPVGPTSGSSRQLKGGNTDSSLFYSVSPVNISSYKEETGWCAFRLCIHINPIK